MLAPIKKKKKKRHAEKKAALECRFCVVQVVIRYSRRVETDWKPSRTDEISRQNNTVWASNV